jgi:manganese oxidase
VKSAKSIRPQPRSRSSTGLCTINGKAYPSTDIIRLKLCQTVKLRFIGSNNNFIHPMHVHGGPFTVVARDGQLLPPQARFRRPDTVNVGSGQRYDVVWRARQPGTWLIHCHIGHHTTNNTEIHGGGGLTMVIEVTT